MHGCFKRAVQVEREPLPFAVRQQIHDLIRGGHTILCVAQGQQYCDLYYRDGSRLVHSVIRTDEAGAA